MKVGIIGLGKMGSGIAERLIQAKHEVFGFDFGQQACQDAAAIGVTVNNSIHALGRHVSIVWLFVPAGDAVDAVLNDLLTCMPQHAIIIDGGNSHFDDSIRRAQRCLTHGIYFLDCGTSGGLAGRQLGYSLMIGGDATAYKQVLPLLTAVAAPGGVGYMGPSGTGHYVKIIHNGIEYGILQAYAEGFHLLKEGSFKKHHLNLEEISRVWTHGALLRSWFLDLAHGVFQKDQNLTAISGEIYEGGTGQWTVDEAHKNNIPVRVIEESLKVRAWSRETGGNYATKVVAMIRNAFGGHAVKKKDTKALHETY